MLTYLLNVHKHMLGRRNVLVVLGDAVQKSATAEISWIDISSCTCEACFHTCFQLSNSLVSVTDWRESSPDGHVSHTVHTYSMLSPRHTFHWTRISTSQRALNGYKSFVLYIHLQIYHTSTHTHTRVYSGHILDSMGRTDPPPPKYMPSQS